MKRRPPERSTRWTGFTIVELMIGLVIGILLIMGIFTLWRSGNKIFRKVDANLEALQSASFVMATLSDDLRNCTVTVTLMNDTNFPFEKTKTGVALRADRKTVQLSKCRAETPFKFPITEPFAANKESSAERIIKWVEYSLSPEKGSNNKEIYHFCRKGPGPSGAEETRVFRESYVKEVELHFLDGSSEQLPGTASGSGQQERLFFARAVVVGCSTTLMELGEGGLVLPDSDYYRVPLVCLFQLDSVSELAMLRGMGPYWQTVNGTVKTP